MARNPNPNEIVVVGARQTPFDDVYHHLLRAPWWVDFALIGAAFVVSNVLFACGFWLVGGVVNATRWLDCFFFSVQTMGTIGYGAMYPVTTGAHLLVVLESIFGLCLVAVATGVVFAKVSLPRARVRFAQKLALSPLNGQPTLMLRTGNQRSNQIVEARVHFAMVRTERSAEGVQLYRLYDLKLERDTSPLFARAWTVLHPVRPDSPLYGATPESLKRDEAEFVVTLMGIDETSGQTVHARTRYFARDVVFGARHADMLKDLSDDRMQLDLARFDELMPTARTDSFPWP